MIGRIENILFDLDGTLTDPKEGIINSILYSLEKMGIKENAVHELDSFIGPPLHYSFLMRYSLTKENADLAVQYYREYFSGKGIFENKVYPGINGLLEFLSARKYKLFVATSKPTIYAEKILQHFKMDTFFTAIIGSNLDNTRTDKTEIISYLISTFGLKAEKTIMIGDRMHDIRGGINNSVKTIGVTYGYALPGELIAACPDYIFENVDEIRDFFM